MRIILLSFCYVNILCYAKKIDYKFDKEVVYSMEINGSKRDISIFINSENDSYYLKTYKSNNTVSAKIFDFKNGRYHIFDLINDQSKAPNFYNFKFASTSRVYLPTKKINFKIQQKENFHDLTIYTNKKMHKVDREIEFTTINSDKSLFFAFKFIALHPFETKENLNIPGRFLVDSATIKTKGNTCKYQLKNINNIDLVLKTE